MLRNDNLCDNTLQASWAGLRATRLKLMERIKGFHRFFQRFSVAVDQLFAYYLDTEFALICVTHLM